MGIEVEEEGELDKVLGDIAELSDDSEKTLKEENAAKKQKLELEASQAEELRLNSLETFGQTKTKKRRSSNDTTGFLREKNAQEKRVSSTRT